ncbi:hypothetical protein JCM8208_001170 [Rhodotorula glutinis]
MPHTAHPASRATSQSPTHRSTTLLDLTNELHQLRVDAVSLKAVDPALAAAVWNALASLEDETTSPPRPLQASVFHVVTMVQQGLLHGAITSASAMAPALAAVDHIISFGSVTNDRGLLEQAHEPSPPLTAATAAEYDSSRSSPASSSVLRHHFPTPSSSASPTSYAARHAVPSFTSAPRLLPSSSEPPSTQPRLNESFIAFEAALIQLRRVQPPYPLSTDALVEMDKAIKALEAAVPSSTAWEALSVVKPRGGLPGPHTSFQQQVMDRLHALIVDLRDEKLWTAEGIRLQANAILGIIDEGKKLAGELKVGHPHTLSSSLQALVTEVKGDLATPTLWHKLEAVDSTSGPTAQTFQWSVYLAVRHLRTDLMNGWIGSPQDVVKACARIRGIIASGSHLGAQLAAERNDRQRFDLSTSYLSSPHVGDPLRRLAGVAFCFVVAAVDAVEHAALANARLSATSHDIRRAVLPCRVAVPSLAVWDELVAVKRAGPPAVTYQQYTLSQLNALANGLRSGGVASIVELELHVRLICATIHEGLHRYVDNSQTMQSLARQRDPSTQLITARTAARYGVSEEKLARRWA